MLDSDDLINAWREDGSRRAVGRQLEFCEEGLRLGVGTLVAEAGQDAAGMRCLKLAGREGEILALLSAAYGRAVSPRVLTSLSLASVVWGKGEVARAQIILAQAGLGSLSFDDPQAPLRLFLTDRLLKRGEEPGAIVDAFGLLPEGIAPSLWRKWAKYSPDQARDERGRWSDGGGGSSSNMSASFHSSQRWRGKPPKDLLLVGNKKPANAAAEEAHQARQALSRERHRPDLNVTPRVQVPGDPVPPSPPDWKRDQVGQSHWNEFHDQLSEMGAGDNARFALGETMAAEGMMERDRTLDSTVYAGIKQSTLDDLQQYDSSFPATPDEMNPRQVAEAYYFLANRDLKDIGGVRALEEISGPENAAAFWDVIVREGRSGGISMVNDACSNIAGTLSETERKRLGLIDNPKSFAEKFEKYKRLTSDTKYAGKVRSELASIRKNVSGERARSDHFAY